ncbi:isochorismatase family protein [Spiroplasma endosymbiont of Panorpa germanica]|uniref:isochorismatase family protein n=1 Tax=Spiroplasma endosymbiont of Panorpa germanica TaxID=3066314 RepID=UPI0030CEC929
MKKALLIVDYQFDFVNPKGSLYVKNAEKLADYINQLINSFKADNQFVFASKDWHPENHYSFEKWGKHCQKNTNGAELCIPTKDIDFTILKGQNQDAESYSAFFDEKGNSNGLDEKMKELEIAEIIVVGVATDICVAKTVGDAIKLGYKTTLDLQGCAGFSDKITF